MAETQQYLSFFLAEEEYALEILRVREVIEYAPLTKVPSMPPCVRGVVNLRGSVVPVIDLGVKFGMPERPVTRFTCVAIIELVVDGELTAIGILADAVSQVLTLAPSEIEAAPTFGTRVRADFLRGMGRVGKKFALILDAEKLLTIDELLTVSALAEPA